MATIPISKTLRTIVKDLSETVEAIDSINGLAQASAELDQRIAAQRKTIAEMDRDISTARDLLVNTKEEASRSVESAREKANNERDKIIEEAHAEASRIIVLMTSHPEIERITATKEQKAIDLEARITSAKQALENYQKSTATLSADITAKQAELNSCNEKIAKVRAEIARIIGG